MVESQFSVIPTLDIFSSGNCYNIIYANVGMDSMGPTLFLYPSLPFLLSKPPM